MTTVVIQAHPLLDSYSTALFASVVEGLEASGSTVSAHRLGEGERPELDDLAAADRLVLVYPTWWGGQPALLLDWLHEVLDAADGPGGSPLRNIGELVAVTSCGSTQLLNTVQGEWGRRYLERYVVPQCASGVELEWLPLYKIDRQPQHLITAHLGTVKERFAAPALSTE